MKILLTVSLTIINHNLPCINFHSTVISDVTIGLRQMNDSVVENETIQVCAELTSGILERAVYVGLEAENSSAIRRT